MRELQRRGRRRDLDPFVRRREPRLDLGARGVWYPFLLGRESGADVLHCPTYRGPSALARAARRHRARPRRAPPPGGVQPLDADVQPARRPARAPRGAARDRGLRVHAARARGAARRPREKIRVVPNAVGDEFTPRRPARGAATTCSPSARSSRARTSRASSKPPRRTGVELRVVGARGWGGVDMRGDGVRWLGEVDDAELARSIAVRALRRVPVALRGLRDSRCSRRWRAARPSSRRAAAAMEEVAGGAAVLVDPLDRRVDRRRASNARPRERDELVARGLERARAFRWERRRRGDASTSTGRRPRERRRSSSSTPTCSAAAAPATRRTSRTCCARFPRSPTIFASPP